jgi:hypothetical protein
MSKQDSTGFLIKQKEIRTMKNLVLAFVITLMMILTSAPAGGQTAGQANKRTSSANNPQQNTMQITAGSTAVTGSGTSGQLTKWTSLSTLGDSIISEDKFGKVGIGTTSPTSKLTVAGMIETTLGGYKFPDGTIQSTAAISGLTSVFHDATLVGNGTSGSPLGLNVPLKLTGSADFPGSLVMVTNTAPSGTGIVANGGAGGVGLAANGGEAMISGFAIGGTGIYARGGDTNTGIGGAGLLVKGGSSLTEGSGGHGVFVYGGNARGANTVGGTALHAIGGGGLDGATDGLAGEFAGDVEITGNLAKGGGSFKIDHPLDPENKYLYHSFVESPDMKNIYDGVTTLDEKGEATVRLPEYFEALNRDFRYLLTAIGAPGPGLYIAEKVSAGRFKIAGGIPGMEVSWQVTGIRQDAFANKNRIEVEVNKSEKERGYYLHPNAFGKSEEKGIEWARNPELMRQVKEARTAAQQKTNDR